MVHISGRRLGISLALSLGGLAISWVGGEILRNIVLAILGAAVAFTGVFGMVLVMAEIMYPQPPEEGQ